jgi:hypothetical protein
MKTMMVVVGSVRVQVKALVIGRQLIESSIFTEEVVSGWKQAETRKR